MQLSAHSRTHRPSCRSSLTALPTPTLSGSIFMNSFFTPLFLLLLDSKQAPPPPGQPSRSDTSDGLGFGVLIRCPPPPPSALESEFSALPLTHAGSESTFGFSALLLHEINHMTAKMVSNLHLLPIPLGLTQRILVCGLPAYLKVLLSASLTACHHLSLPQPENHSVSVDGRGIFFARP